LFIIKEKVKVRERRLDGVGVYYESIKRELNKRLGVKKDKRLKIGRVVYYESIKRELKTKLIYECRCDERLKTKVEESTRVSIGLL
jgi:hypothetical protein